jgi:hypothetical protein
VGYVDIDGRAVTGQKYDVTIGVNPDDSEYNLLPAPITKLMKFLSLQKVKIFLEPVHDCRFPPLKCLP